MVAKDNNTKAKSNNIKLYSKILALCSKNDIIIYSLIPILCLFNTLFFNSFIDSTSTSALTSQNNTSIEFTLNPTLSLSLSGSLSLLGLQPGTSADSNVITIDIGTNNVTGYTLSANVGNSTNNTTSLTNTNDDNYTFTNLSSSISSLSDFNDNEWGYSYSVDNGTNWLSGDITSPSNGYGGLPIYSSTNSPKLNETYSPSNDSIKFKIGAKASSNQVAGTYTNVVNFMAVTNAVPMSISDAFALAGAEQVNGYYTMQDMTSSICEAVELEGNDSVTELIDIRDGEVYKISKLKDGNCWMLDNLNTDPTNAFLTSNNTNATSAIIDNYLYGGNPDSMAGWSNTAVANTTSGFTTYTEPLVNTAHANELATNYGSGSGKVGTYYNYCAASIGTFCYDKHGGIDLPDTLIDVVYDICPSHWRMPTSGANGELTSLYHNHYYSGDTSNTDSLQYNLSVALSGNFYDDSQVSFDVGGFYWSSTYYGEYENSTRVYNLSVSATNVYPQIGGNHRFTGFSVRCLAK